VTLPLEFIRTTEQTGIIYLPENYFISKRYSAKRMRSLNPLNAKLNPICHLLVLLGAHHILDVSRIRVNIRLQHPYSCAFDKIRFHISRRGKGYKRNETACRFHQPTQTNGITFPEDRRCKFHSRTFPIHCFQ